MNNLFLGKINLSKIDKSKLFKSEKGNFWMDITIWQNDIPDDFGNTIAIQQSTGKDEKKIYIGNCKPWQPPKIETVPDEIESKNEQEDQLPF